jgi:superfamily II RNA helicase
MFNGERDPLSQAGQFKKVSRTGRPFKTMKGSAAALIPKYSDIALELHKLKRLPAIVFIFSRQGCDDAAKMVMQQKSNLLAPDEVTFVNNAINAFVAANPDIPVNKASVMMLRAGVGVHHAGLITVWKAFIEDLFNANKIKILFATETLAAGVNMPARTTVISTVTKRINSEVVKLKTSQLLQMAGRAGRRGKDSEGTVVIMRNRFEDSQMAHKILTSPVDGILSHFKVRQQIEPVAVSAPPFYLSAKPKSKLTTSSPPFPSIPFCPYLLTYLSSYLSSYLPPSRFMPYPLRRRTDSR